MQLVASADSIKERRLAVLAEKLLAHRHPASELA
jgi:hypothetical protein